MFADQVIPFVFESLPVRGEVICLSRAWRRMLAGNDYARIVQATLGEAAAATGLIAQSLKFEGSVTLQIVGGGDLRMLVMQCTDDLELRGMASSAPTVTAATFGELVRAARCAITVDTGERPYQGIVEVVETSFAASLEHYFARSVQVPSHVGLACSGKFSSGMLLQKMPGRPMDEDDWNRLGMLIKTLKIDDFTNTSGVELIGRIFAEDDVRVFKARPVIFKCRCSMKRAEDVLRMLGEAEIRSALEEQGKLEVTCEYCGQRRRFDSVDVSRLFAGNVVGGPESVQ